jgi:hypothetical protein
MVSVTGDEVLPAKFPAAAYVAVAVSVPAASAVVANVATPLPFRLPTPREVEPLKKVTLPAGTPTVEVTVAVNVTLAPAAALAGALNVVVVEAPVTWKLCVAVAAL